MQQVKEQVFYLIISSWFMHCLICELAHSCSKPFNSAELISAFFSFPQDQPQLLPGWLTGYKSGWQSLPRHMWRRLSAFGAVLGVSEPGSLEHMEHMAHPGLSAPSAVIVREVKFREMGREGQWGSVNVGCKSGRLKNTILPSRGRDFKILMP